MVEISVSIKTTDSTLKKNYTIYEPFVMNENDPIIRECIQDAIKSIVTESIDIEGIKVRSLIIAQ